MDLCNILLLSQHQFCRVLQMQSILIKSFLHVSRAKANMELSLEARLTKSNITNDLHVHLTGTFVSAETGLQLPNLPCKTSAGCSTSSLQAALSVFCSQGVCCIVSYN